MLLVYLILIVFKLLTSVDDEDQDTSNLTLCTNDEEDLSDVVVPTISGSSGLDRQVSVSLWSTW